MSDVDLLRRAAAKIRETANAAPRGPYMIDPTPGYNRQILADDCDPIGAVRDWSGGLHDGTGSAEQTAAHIILWHPGVALAVAGWLEHEAGMAHDAENRATLLGRPLEYPHEVLEAVTVARALLGEA